jgi:hypothetical protein
MLRNSNGTLEHQIYCQQKEIKNQKDIDDTIFTIPFIDACAVHI